MQVANSGTGNTIRALNSGSGIGVYASGVNGPGVQGESLGGPGGLFVSTASGFGVIVGTPAVGLGVTGPMTINNTTKVVNLNADLLDGNDSSAFLGVGATAANSSLLGGQAASAFLGAGATAANSSQLIGISGGNFPYFIALTAGDPGVPTHTVTLRIGATDVRFHVSIP